MKRTYPKANGIPPFWLFWLCSFYTIGGTLFFAWPYSIIIGVWLAASNPQHLQRTLLFLRKHHPHIVPDWNVRAWLRRNPKVQPLITVVGILCVFQFRVTPEEIMASSSVLYIAGLAWLCWWIWSYQIAGPDSPLLTAPAVKFDGFKRLLRKERSANPG